MNLIISPVKKIKGRIRLPASKSYSIRAFIVAACGGSSKIKHPSDCEDAVIAMSVARDLEAKVKRAANNLWNIQAQQKKGKTKSINVGESGTALRFVLPLLPLSFEKATVTGRGTLKGRPNKHLTKTLRAMNVNIRGAGSKESIPVRFKGGEMKGGRISIDGSLSSQFISALMIASPRLDENTILKITGKKIVSQDYVTMTRQILKESGITVQKKSEKEYRVKGKQKFKGLKNFTVPSDYGLAAFMMAAGALVKSDLILNGTFQDKFVQADGAILGLMKRMGVKFQKTSHAIKIKGPFPLKGGSFSLRDCPDLVPIMSILALFAKGKTRLYDIAHVRTKESDRISDLRKELLKIGAKVKEGRNELIITPVANYKSNVVLNPHNDHRLAMAFSVLGLKIGTKVKNIECSHKSYPRFVKDFKALGTNAKKLNRV